MPRWLIDQETEAKNQTVDASKEDQFKQNEAAGGARQKTIDDTTAGVQKTLDQMREEARVAREAGRQSQKIAPKSVTSKWQLPKRSSIRP